MRPPGRRSFGQFFRRFLFILLARRAGDLCKCKMGFPSWGVIKLGHRIARPAWTAQRLGRGRHHATVSQQCRLERALRGARAQKEGNNIMSRSRGHPDLCSVVLRFRNYRGVPLGPKEGAATSPSGSWAKRARQAELAAEASPGRTPRAVDPEGRSAGGDVGCPTRSLGTPTHNLTVPSMTVVDPSSPQ